MASSPQRTRVRLGAMVIGSALWIIALGWLWYIRSNRDDDSQSRTGPIDPPHKFKVTYWELPEFSLTDQNGRTVTKKDLLGKQWVASFLFTRCTKECPMVRGQLRTLKDATADSDVRIVTISVDPKHDTPAVLKRHAKSESGDDDRWLFLTGPEKTVYTLLKDGFKETAVQVTGEQRQPGREVLHSQRVMHIDENGRVIATYDGKDPVDMERLRRAIRSRADAK